MRGAPPEVLVWGGGGGGGHHLKYVHSEPAVSNY